MIIGVIHTAFGLYFGRSPLMEIVRNGFWNAVDPDRERQLIFWFLFAGVAWFLLGQLIYWLEKRSVVLPKFLAWEFLGIAVACGILMPGSGFWLFLIPLILLFRGQGQHGAT